MTFHCSTTDQNSAMLSRECAHTIKNRKSETWLYITIELFLSINSNAALSVTLTLVRFVVTSHLY